MSVLSFVQILRSYFLFSTVGFVFINEATPCQVYPSEYAYRDDSVTRAGSASANCRRYPPGNLPGSWHPEDYIHCDGTQLKLIDFNFGQEQYQSSDYYQWSAGDAEQLLFIFPTRVSLTTITLHYYSDSIRGLPRLRFYAVPDDFDVWDATTIGTPYAGIASVPPGGEPAGPGSGNIRLNANFNAKKVLMYKYSSSFQFAMSEVEFFTAVCTPFTTTDPITTAHTSQPATSTSSMTTTTPLKIPSITNTGSPEFPENGSYGTQSSSSLQITSNSRAREIVAWILVVILVVLLIVSLAIHVVQAIWICRVYRRNKKTDTRMSLDYTVALDSNPCYEASNVKQTEAQEAVHVYETVKQQS